MKQAVCVLVQTTLDFENLGSTLVLGTSRRNDSTAWGLPGGKVEPNETRRTAAIRELWEETGLSVSDSFSLNPIFVGVDDAGWVTTTFAYFPFGPGRLRELKLFEPTPRPGEPPAAWVTWTDLFQGPFGAYNKALFSAYYTSIYRMKPY